MLKKLEEKVSGLIAQASSILLLKDQLYDFGKDNWSYRGSLTATDSKRGFQLGRNINDGYRAWYAVAWPLVTSNLKERTAEFELFYLSCGMHLGAMVDTSGLPSGDALLGFENAFSAQIGLVRSIPGAIESRAL